MDTADTNPAVEYQMRTGDFAQGEWRPCTKEQFDYFTANPQFSVEVRALYTATTKPADDAAIIEAVEEALARGIATWEECSPAEVVLAFREALAPATTKPAVDQADLTFYISALAKALAEAAPGNPLASEAMQFLHKKGLVVPLPPVPLHSDFAVHPSGAARRHRQEILDALGAPPTPAEPSDEEIYALWNSVYVLDETEATVLAFARALLASHRQPGAEGEAGNG